MLLGMAPVLKHRQVSGWRLFGRVCHPECPYLHKELFGQQLVSSHNSVLKGNITMDTLLSAIDCSQPFQVVADLKLRHVFTLIMSRGATTLLLHTMDLASPATFQI